MESILITGSRGFIASGLVGDGIDLKDGVDIRTYRATKPYDVVIHTAAKVSVTESMAKPEEYITTNVLGTLNILTQHPEAHFIYLSTASVYGEGRFHTTYSKMSIESIYACTKYLGELLVKVLAPSWCILRLTNVIGPGERGEPNVYQVFEKEDILPIYGDGTQTRDFIHVDKVRKVIMESVRRRGVYNVGSGVSKTILEVAEEFQKPVKFLPRRAGEIHDFGIEDSIC